MARSKGRIAQTDSEKITVGPEERVRIKKAREGRGWKQKELGDRVGVSQGTISNLESGKHPQIYKSVYAAIRRVLHLSDEMAASDEVYRQIVEGALELGESEQRAVAALIDQLKKPKTN